MQPPTMRTTVQSALKGPDMENMTHFSGENYGLIYKNLRLTNMTVK